MFCTVETVSNLGVAAIPRGKASALFAQHGVPLPLVPQLNNDPDSRTTPRFETVSFSYGWRERRSNRRVGGA